MVTSIVERLSSVIVVIYGYRDSKQTNLTVPAVKTDLCCPCFTSSSSISSPHHHCASQITRETCPDSKSHPTNLGIIDRCKKWRWLVKNGSNRLNEEKVNCTNEDLHEDHVSELKYGPDSSSIEIDDCSRWKPQKQFVVVVDLDSNNNDTNDGKSDTLSGSTHDIEMTSKKPVKASPVKLTFEGFGSSLDGQSLQRRSLNQHHNASLDEESICSSKDTCSALTGKKSASLYFHQICDELPPFSSEQVYNNNKTKAYNVKNTNTKNSKKPENNSDNNISNKNNIDTKDKCWETRTGKNSELGENISASLESNLPGNQPNIGESIGGRRKQSLTVPEELKFHPHHSHHLLSSTSHQHHHHRHQVHRYGQHSRDASPEHSHIHQHCLRQYTPRHHTQQHHHRASSMGHQQLEHRSDEGTIEESASPKCKTEPSRSPSPLSTPSPSGSTSLQFFSRPFDDQSIGSSCSSSGVELEFTRKCTVSADSLLLHPDITGSSSDTGVTSVNLGGAMGGGSRMGHQYHHSSHPSYHHLSETVSGSTGTCLGQDEAKPMSSDSSLEAGKGYKAGLLLDPGSLVKRKISGSLSSDQIHDDLMFSDKVTLTPGTRSVSPKMIFTGKYRRDKNTSTSSPSASRVTGKQVNPSEPLTGSPSTAGVSIPITSQPSTSQSPSTSEKRKASMANVVLSGPGRLARLLRRTHSAGCSKDVPSHALFLREKPMKHHATSAPTTEGEMGDKRRGRKQAPALEDMKQRLRFLRRRHTDSSIQSTNVRPTPEEASKWSESFHLLMRNKYGATLFKAFLAREYSQENIEFWIACEEFKKVRPAKMPSKARKIYDDFVAVKSPKEINLDPNLRTNIFQSLTAPEEGTFDIAQRKIQGMLEQDAYLRFLQSELYRDLLVPNEPKKADATCKYESGKLSPESHL